MKNDTSVNSTLTTSIVPSIMSISIVPHGGAFIFVCLRGGMLAYW